MSRFALAAFAASLLVACSSPPVRPDRWIPADAAAAAREEVARAVVVGLAGVEAAAAARELDCQQVTFELYACPTEIALESWGWENHLREAAESDLRIGLDPPDPAPVRDGLDVYADLLRVAFRTRTQLDLLEHTPVYNASEVAYFQAHPDVWADVVAIWSAPPGDRREDLLEEAVQRRRADERAVRHLVLRDGTLYFDDPDTANWAAQNLRLRDLFGESETTVVLERNGVRHTLQRGSGGHYYHTDPDMEAYRERLSVLDRVGLPDELTPTASYNLRALRRRLGLEHLEVGAETGAGRAGFAHFANGDHIPARLVRAEPGVPLLGLVASPARLNALVEGSRWQTDVLYDLMDVAAQMVREVLFFDEPPNEVGQQDGIMRPAFARATREGRLEYLVNGVTVAAYDEQGRARPPQVCIDFITDVVERYAGSWWPDRSAGSRGRTTGRINIRSYMPFRQVAELVKLAESRPEIADVERFDEDGLVQFRTRDAFFDNLWRTRERIRIGDVIVIYGLRSDNRNHWHSFYVFDTDPLHGMPITLADQAGEARVRSWTDIMRTAPLRSIRSRVRWNPIWIRNPEGVELAEEVADAAVMMTAQLAAMAD